MARPPRWVTETKDDHSEWYVERFRTMAAAGDDLAGEARMIDAMVPRGARILDAGCGPGRVGAELHARGHEVVGVDVDPVLIEAAEANVMVFLAPDTETEVLRRVAAHVKPDGAIVVGFHVNRELPLAQFDDAVAAAGLAIEHRFATWDLRAWHDDADFAVTVLRHPA